MHSVWHKGLSIISPIEDEYQLPGVRRYIWCYLVYFLYTKHKYYCAHNLSAVMEEKQNVRNKYKCQPSVIKRIILYVNDVSSALYEISLQQQCFLNNALEVKTPSVFCNISERLWHVCISVSFLLISCTRTVSTMPSNQIQETLNSMEIPFIGNNAEKPGM